MNVWLIAVSVLVVAALIGYLIPVARQRTKFDLHTIVPMFLESSGLVASGKMMVLAPRG